MDMTSTRPYLIRAIYEWIVDNSCKPFLLIDARVPGVRVPPQAVKDGQVLLNIAPHSVDRLDLGLDEIRFNARFSGVSQSIIAPVAAVLAIYAQENGQGMMFPAESEDADGAGEETAADAERTGPVSATANTPNDDEPPQPPPARMRPSLRIVK